MDKPMKELVGRILHNKWTQRIGLATGILGAVAGGSRIIPQDDIIQSIGGTTPIVSENAAGINKQYIPLIINPLSAPTSTPTPISNPEITPTSPPTVEGTPTLSPEEHYSTLNLIDSETSNGVAVNIWKTNSAIVTADFNDAYRGELARLTAINSQNLGTNSFTSVDLVFVKNRGDSPTGVFMGGTSFRNQNNSFTYGGVSGYARAGGKLILYYGLETGLDRNDARLMNSINNSFTNGLIQFCNSGVSPMNNISFTDEEINVTLQQPIRLTS